MIASWNAHCDFVKSGLDFAQSDFKIKQLG